MAENSKIRKLSIIVFALLMLAFFPFMALYMSSSGLSAYKKLRAEMKAYPDSIKVPDVALYSQSNYPIGRTSLDGKIVVAHFYDKNCTDCEVVWTELKRVQQEFSKKAKKRVVLLTHVLNKAKTDSLQALIQKQGIDTVNWTMVSADTTVMMDLIAKGYKIDMAKSPYTIALLDRNGIIANYYDARNKEEMNKMMTHMTILIPAKEDRKRIKFEREKEVYK